MKMALNAFNASDNDLCRVISYISYGICKMF